MSITMVQRIKQVARSSVGRSIKMLIFVFTKFHRTDFFHSAVFFIKLKLRKVIVVSMINDERLRQKAPALIKEVRNRVLGFGFI